MFMAINKLLYNLNVTGKIVELHIVLTVCYTILGIFNLVWFDLGKKKRLIIVVDGVMRKLHVFFYLISGTFRVGVHETCLIFAKFRNLTLQW